MALLDRCANKVHSFDFFGLPPELRIMVYLESVSSTAMEPKKRVTHQEFRDLLAFALANKEVFSQLMPMIWKNVHLDARALTSDSAVMWFCQVSETQPNFEGTLLLDVEDFRVDHDGLFRRYFTRGRQYRNRYAQMSGQLRRSMSHSTVSDGVSQVVEDRLGPREVARLRDPIVASKVCTIEAKDRSWYAVVAELPSSGKLYVTGNICRLHIFRP